MTTNHVIATDRLHAPHDMPAAMEVRHVAAA